MFITQIAKVGALTGVSVLVSSVARTVGGTFTAVKKTAMLAKDITLRKTEFADLKSQTQHQMNLMGLRADQRQACVDYGARTATQKAAWADLDPTIQDDLLQWEGRFPKL